MSRKTEENGGPASPTGISTSGELEVDEDMNAKDSELAFKSEDDTGLSAEYLKARRTQNDTELASHKVREDDVGVSRADVCIRGDSEAEGDDEGMGLRDVSHCNIMHNRTKNRCHLHASHCYHNSTKGVCQSIQQG